MQMKLKSYFLSSETFLRLFLKAHSITIEQYQQEMENLEKEHCDLFCQERIVCGVDTYPYIYIIHTLRKSRPQELCNFLVYFSAMYNKYSGNDNIIISVDDINMLLSNKVLILYLVAAMQYYFT